MWHWGRFFSVFFSFPLLIIIPSLLHIHLSPSHVSGEHIIGILSPVDGGNIFLRNFGIDLQVHAAL
jgi:hypothetical protein